MLITGYLLLLCQRLEIVEGSMFFTFVEHVGGCSCVSGIDRMDGIMFVCKECILEVFCSSSMWFIYFECVTGKVRMSGVMRVSNRCVAEVWCVKPRDLSKVGRRDF